MGCSAFSPACTAQSSSPSAHPSASSLHPFQQRKVFLTLHPCPPVLGTDSPWVTGPKGSGVFFGGTTLGSSPSQVPPMLTGKKKTAMESAFGIQGASNSFGLGKCHIARAGYIALHPDCSQLPCQRWGEGPYLRGGGQAPPALQQAPPAVVVLEQGSAQHSSMALTSAAEQGAKPHGVQRGAGCCRRSRQARAHL